MKRTRDDTTIHFSTRSISNRPLCAWPRDSLHSLLETVLADENAFSTLADDTFDELPRLTYLSIQRNRYQLVLPEGLAMLKLVGLVKLELDGSHLGKVPTGIGYLTNLSYLSITDNRLRSLSEEMSRLTSLTYFNAANNHLVTLPDYLATNWRELKELIVSNNCITRISVAALSSMRKLNILNLSRNALGDFFLGTTLSLPSLRRLHLSANRLTALPRLSVEMALGHVNLAHNQLAYISDESFIKPIIHSLRVFDVSDNSRLVTVPLRLALIPSLQLPDKLVKDTLCYLWFRKKESIYRLFLLVPYLTLLENAFSVYSSIGVDSHALYTEIGSFLTRLILADCLQALQPTTMTTIVLFLTAQ